MRLFPAMLVLSALPALSQPAPVPAASLAPAAATETPKPQVKPRVRIQTTFGPIVLELEPGLTPKTVENFLTYVKEGYYAGTIFHRVIQDSLIQGGGLKEDMSEKAGHLPIFNEARLALAGGLKNVAGTVAMARAENPHSATSQFFINVGDNPAFDPHGVTPEGYGYCVFGRVVEGMETVLKIGKVQTVWRKGQPCVPEYLVRLKSAELIEAAPEAATPAATTPAAVATTPTAVTPAPAATPSAPAPAPR